MHTYAIQFFKLTYSFRYGPAIEYGNSEKAKGVIDYWHILVSDILNCRTHQMGTNAPAYVARPTLGKV